MLNKSSETLGFSIACHKGDLPLIGGCLSSIRYFAPDAPICLITDGNFSTRTYERVYGVQVIRRENVKNPDLRKLSYGYGLTKMIALWESPFDIVFHVDADAVLWGDIRKNLPKGDWDFVYNEPHEIITDFIQKTQYFDPQKVFEHIEPFPWQVNPYFNTGVFCCRKGVLDLDEYLRMLKKNIETPGLFFFDQGMLNIMVFRAIHADKLLAKSAHLQTVIPVSKKQDLENHFQIVNGTPVIRQPTILHWAGPKPWEENKGIFRTPMDYFRERSLRECGFPKMIPAKLGMDAQELKYRHMPKLLANIKKILKKFSCQL